MRTQTKPCPNCNSPIFIKSFRRDLERCIICMHATCPSCRIQGYCLDCFIKHASVLEKNMYYTDKYGVTA